MTEPKTMSKHTPPMTPEQIALKHFPVVRPCEVSSSGLTITSVNFDTDANEAPRQACLAALREMAEQQPKLMACAHCGGKTTLCSSAQTKTGIRESERMALVEEIASTLTEERLVCTVCGQPGNKRCTDCLANLKTKIILCDKEECLAAHEKVCSETAIEMQDVDEFLAKFPQFANLEDRYEKMCAIAQFATSRENPPSEQVETCGQSERDAELLRLVDDPRTIFYGPHQCPDGCGATICRASLEQGGMMFDYPRGIIYPNTNWFKHVCAAKILRENHAESGAPAKEK